LNIFHEVCTHLNRVHESVELFYIIQIVMNVQ
jgi:hypothetical protein